jgi:hypothetical protein
LKRYKILAACWQSAVCDKGIIMRMTEVEGNKTAPRGYDMGNNFGPVCIGVFSYTRRHVLEGVSLIKGMGKTV